MSEKRSDNHAEKMKRLKANMVFRGIKQSEVARLLGVTPSLVCAVMNGTKKSARVVTLVETLLKTRIVNRDSVDRAANE